MSPLFVYIIWGVITVILFVIAYRGKKQPGSTLRRNIESDTAAIISIPYEIASDRVSQYLQDSSMFKVIRWDEYEQPKYSLPSGVMVLQKQYKSISSVRGETNINFAKITRWKVNKNYYKIGTDVMGSYILIRPDDETIYLLDGSENTEEEISDNSYPSIYHYLLVIIKDLYDINIKDH
jgi:hypothetical protein